jgi:hypothetical protein
MTRGERNNNPGNIHRIAGVIWEGEAADQSGDDAFVIFNSPIYGIRAITRIMLSYEREGLNTVEVIIDRWAPPNENNSVAYIDAVCTECSVQPDTVIDVQTTMPYLIKGIIFHENGELIYSDLQIDAAIALA